MRISQPVCGILLLACPWLLASNAYAQSAPDESRFVVDIGVGVDASINGNVNSGAIGRLEGQAAAILPNSYGDVYGTGIQLRVGVGYVLDEATELRAILIFQSADADLVRLGDLGPSSLYAQYSDYQNLALDFGYRRYIPTPSRSLRAFAEGTIGFGFIDSINAELAAPQSNAILSSTDFYDQTAAFTWSISGGVLFRVAEQLDFTAQLGLRHASGLSKVDQFVGTGLEDINNDSARLTFPVVVGLRVRFK
jgi:hypothetical protein